MIGSKTWDNLKHNNNVKTLLFYLLVSVIYTRGILFSSGPILGADWGLPYTESQIDIYFKSGYYSWWNGNLLVGYRQPFSVSIWFQLLFKFLSIIGFSGGTIIRGWILLIYTLGGYSMFLLCRYLTARTVISVISGLFFISTPVYFNYTIVGWTFALFSLSLMPITTLFLIKSIRNNNSVYAIIVGLLFSMAVIQSQSIIWYTLIFAILAIYLINNKKTLTIYIKNIILIYIVLTFSQLIWIIPLYFSSPDAMLDGTLSKNSMSIGTWVRLNFINVFRLYGASYNYQYESIVDEMAQIFSFSVPFVFLLGAIILKKSKLYLSLLLIYLVLPLSFFMGPNIISSLPFSNAYRDIARFTLISNFVYPIMLSLVTVEFTRSGKRYSKYVIFLLIFSGFVNSLPFFRGDLVKESTKGFNIPIRSLDFPESYSNLENYMLNREVIGKILYLPMGEVIEFKGSKLFSGSFNGVRDIYAIFSPVAGGTTFLQSGVTGKPPEVISKLNESLIFHDFEGIDRILRELNVQFIAIRRNLVHPYGSELLYHDLERQDYIEKVNLSNSDEIVLLEHKKTLPLISINNNFDTNTNTNDNLNFRKLNSTKYIVNINNVNGLVKIRFLESFDPNWKIFSYDGKSKSLLDKYDIFFSAPLNLYYVHNKIFDYANEWVFNVQEYCEKYKCSKSASGNYNVDLVIEYEVQKYLSIGLALGVISLILSLIFIFIKSKNKNLVW